MRCVAPTCSAWYGFVYILNISWRKFESKPVLSEQKSTANSVAHVWEDNLTMNERKNRINELTKWMSELSVYEIDNMWGGP